MPPQKGVRQATDPNRDLLGYGDTVVPLLPKYVSRRSGEAGLVRRVRLTGGNLLVTVEFSDGTREDFWEEDLRRTARAKTRVPKFD